MDVFLEEVLRIRSILEGVIEDLSSLPFDAFLIAGGVGFYQLEFGGETLASATFADHLCEPRLHIPKNLIQSMCLGAFYIDNARRMPDGEQSYSLVFLSKAAEKIGFLHGAAATLINQNEKSRGKLSRHGKKGALSRHRMSAELKAWALLQAKSQRGADKDIARILATQIPKHLINASKDPQRLIYDALRTPSKPS